MKRAKGDNTPLNSRGRNRFREWNGKSTFWGAKSKRGFRTLILLPFVAVARSAATMIYQMAKLAT